MTTAFSICDLAKTKRVSIFGRYGTGPGLAVWHKRAIPALDKALAAALKTKYGQQLTKDGIVWTYACRDISGSGSHSEHSHPIAIDVNPPKNGMNDDGILRTDFNRFGNEDAAAFVNAFIDAGFSWGGDGWTGNRITPSFFNKVGKKIRDGRVDAMHFEYDGPPQRYVRRTIYKLRFSKTPGGETHKRTFPTFKKLMHFLNRDNRNTQNWAKVEWERKERMEVV